MSFTHLHLHTEYSLLDGFARIDRLFDAVASRGMSACAITDHGVMFGAVHFYQAAIKKGIKPIIGCEVYIAPRSMQDKDSRYDKNPYHLVLLAENTEGYYNLIKLVSKSYTEGFYYKPRVDKELLKQHAKGLIALSSCLAGEIPRALLNKNSAEAKHAALSYIDIFGRDNFFLELQENGIPEQKEVNIKLLKLAKELNLEIVATNDVHYISRSDAKTHDVLLAMQTGKTIHDSKRLKFRTDEFYLKSADEMIEQFSYAPRAIENTMRIAERCTFEFDFETRHLPNFDVPANLTAKDYLYQKCQEGLNNRYHTPSKNIIDRLDQELTVIVNMGFEDYFLIVWDFVMYAKKNNIFVGPCRGSGGGSLAAYVLGITDVDPIKHGLIFERFLNPERVTMPDFDIDFQDDRRNEVIAYVIKKYGVDRVSQIITFGTLSARAAIKGVGRALGMAYKDVDKASKAVPRQLGITIDKALNISDELKTMYEKTPEIAHLIDMAKAVEGVPSHASTHAAGIVISSKSVDSYVPLYVHDKATQTQYTMTELEALGLLKMDFLGLTTLTILQQSLAIIKHTRGIDIDLNALTYEDKSAFDLIASGNNLGVFQLESKGMIRFMKALKPSQLEDIIAGLSLYRPGPMDAIPTYIANKNNPAKIKYIDEKLEPILKKTYGCLIYQEQVMEIVRALGGYSYGRSDLIRRAMSKKKMRVMQKERPIFVKGCIERGIDENKANAIFDDMIDFAKYAFNKSHAAGYAMLAYQTAYLKVHYPAEFMAATMSNCMGSQNRMALLIRDCKRMGIEVALPDVQYSDALFTVSDGIIRLGLLAIKNVGSSIAKTIVLLRKEALFKDFEDFLRRLPDRELNKKTIESMIKAGAFDSFQHSRAVLITNFEQLIDSIQSDRRFNTRGQLRLFDALDNADEFKFKFKDRAPFSQAIRLDFEREVLGMYISGHPLDEYKDLIYTHSTISASDIFTEDVHVITPYVDQTHTLTGIASAVVNKGTKKGETMAFVTLEDLTGTIEVIIFPKLYRTSQMHLKKDVIISVKGRVSQREDEAAKLIAEQIFPVNKSLLEEVNKKLYIKTVAIDRMQNEFLKKWAAENVGQVPVIIYETSSNKSYTFLKKVKPTSQNINVLRLAFGEENVILK